VVWAFHKVALDHSLGDDVLRVGNDIIGVPILYNITFMHHHDLVSDVFHDA
jgi:hypothetical protein